MRKKPELYRKHIRHEQSKPQFPLLFYIHLYMIQESPKVKCVNVIREIEFPFRGS